MTDDIDRGLWDSAKHPRVPGGAGGGRFRSLGGGRPEHAEVADAINHAKSLGAARESIRHLQGRRLKRVAKAHGVPTHGTDEEIQHRLVDAVAHNYASHRIGGAQTASEARTIVGALNGQHVTAALRERNLSTSGTLPEMRQRLIDALTPNFRGVHRSQMSTQDINDLPDEDFAYIEPGGEKDDSGRTVPRSLRHFPIHDEAHVRNALSRAPQSPFGDQAMAKIHKAAKKMGIGDYGDDEETRSEMPTGLEVLRYDRSWDLDDIYIQRTGDGRTVEAYAAVFDSPSEIKDQHGHYMEVIDRRAFNRELSHGINRVNVFYNHGFTIHGTADGLTSVPIGSPVDIRPDGRGLRTVTRFNRSTLADSVLEAIRAGDIRGYSFRGRIFQSDPARVPRQRPGDRLPTITRTVLGLAEYGPTPTPAYADAGIVAVRSAQEIAAQIVSLDAAERAELVRMFNAPTPDTATPDTELGTEDSPDERSGRFQQFQAELRKRGVLH